VSGRAQQWGAASIRALRGRVGCTQEEMADALGVWKQTICEWENDYYRPTGRHCKVLDLFAGRALILEEYR
jgi:DNA-binding XRE family transcriptional regulator